MADVDTPNCRATSAIVMPCPSTNLHATSALTSAIFLRRLPLRNSAIDIERS